MAVRKTDKGWIADVTYYKLNGKQSRKRSSPSKTRKEALAEERRIERELATDFNGNENMTIDDLCDDFVMFKKRKVEQITVVKIQGYIDNHILPYFSGVSANKVNARMIMRWQDDLIEKKLSNTYINKITFHFSAIYKHAMAQFSFIERNPVYLVGTLRNSEKAPKRILTLDEYNKLDNYLKNALISERVKLRSRLHYHLLYFYGLRKGESLALQWKDINFEEQLLPITKSCTQKIKGVPYILSEPKTKGSKRTLYLTDYTISLFKDFYDYESCLDTFNEDYFVFGGNRPLGETTLSSAKKRHFKAAGVTEVTFHEFRHTYTTNMYYSDSVKDKSLSLSLGHSTTEITLDTYTHELEKRKKDVVNAISILQKQLE